MRSVAKANFWTWQESGEKVPNKYKIIPLNFIISCTAEHEGVEMMAWGEPAALNLL